MKRFIFSIFTVITTCFPVFGQKYVNEFLNIGVGARAHGMFGSVIATVEDGTSGYWNPAGLTGLTNPIQINAMHTEWFGGISNYDYISVSTKLNKRRASGASFSFIRLGTDNIPNTLNLIAPDGTVDYNRVTQFSASDYAGIVSYGTTLGSNERISIGGSVKVIHRSIGSFGKSWGFGADFGLKYKGDKFSLGVMARDVTSTFNAWSFNLKQSEKDVFASTGNDIPVSSSEVMLPRVILGAAIHDIRGSFSYLAELDLNVSTLGAKSSIVSSKNFNIEPSLGVELGYVQKVFVRFGLGNIQSVVNPVNTVENKFEIQPNVGLGLKLGKLRIDYALANVGSLGGILPSNIFSLTLDFAPRPKS